MLKGLMIELTSKRCKSLHLKMASQKINLEIGVLFGATRVVATSKPEKA